MAPGVAAEALPSDGSLQKNVRQTTFARQTGATPPVTLPQPLSFRLPIRCRAQERDAMSKLFSSPLVEPVAAAVPLVPRALVMPGVGEAR